MKVADENIPATGPIKIKIIVAGGRDYNDYARMKEIIEKIVKSHDLLPNNVMIISGHADGADLLAEKVAEDNHYNLKVFPAKWDTTGEYAGFVRNSDMAYECNYLKDREGHIPCLLAFWNGKSVGTRSMIHLAMDYNMEIHIFPYQSSNDKKDKTRDGKNVKY